MNLPLQIRQSTGLSEASVAWFLPGADPAHWLEILAEGGLAAPETALFVVPRSRTDRSPAGLLAIASGDTKPIPGALPCRALASRLYLPADATLFPPLTDTEVMGLYPAEVTFFHPAYGLSSFESALRLWDLLAPPQEQSARWNRAQPGTDPLPLLSSIVLAVPPSLEDIFGDAPQEIGSDPVTDLPPAPDEPSSSGLSQTGRNLQRMFAQGIAKFIKHLPHTGSQRTWLNNLEDWANRKTQHIQSNLDKIRNKELHRLLNLLKNNPDQGLRHAIPFNKFPHRGKAPPGGQLGSHSLDFNLSRLGGGGPADFWDIPFDLQEQLIRHYRELANRELQLGRYRRAAYIFAELLGDLVSAASALKQGRLYREAAVLYDQHLHNPLEAARCLAEGGFLDEAIPRLEKLNRWLDVADLQERLGNKKAAHAAIRRVVEERRKQDDIVGAADLVEKRLHLPEEALEILESAWPNSRQAVHSVDASFQLLSRLGRHDDTLLRLARFAAEPLPNHLATPLLNVLGSAVHNYPHEGVRHISADLSRVLISAQLQRADLSGEQSGKLMSYLTQLAPQDRLLTRDTNRFLGNRREAEIRKARQLPPALPVKSGKKPVVLRHLELPRQLEWVQLRTEGLWLFAAGVSAKRLTVLRGVWEGQFQSLSWECNGHGVREDLAMEPTRNRGHYLALDALAGPAFPEKQFPAADSLFFQRCTAGTPSWLTQKEFTFTYGEDFVYTADVSSGRAVLLCFDKKGALLQTTDITEGLLHGAERLPSTRFSLLAIPQGCAIALGNRLLVLREGTSTSVDLPGQAVRLACTPPHTKPAVVVSLEHGAIIHWLGSKEWTELDRDIASPLATFISGGPLTLLSGNHLLFFEVDSRGIHEVTRMEFPGEAPVAISPTDHPNQLAILERHGRITIYHWPR